ncbi:MAG: membrane protein insertase YidC [Candidatus Edwardsbacteria bacterium]|nr:membrane protein insertase YidC [Candidatus Edwardsbacteria bacterium]
MSESTNRTLIAMFLIVLVFLGFNYLMPRQQAPAPKPAADTAAAPQSASISQPEPEAKPAASAPRQKAGFVPVKLVTLAGNGFEAAFTSQGGDLVSYTLTGFKGPDNKPVQLIPAEGRALGCELTVGGKPLDLAPVAFRVTEQTGQSVAFAAALDNGAVVTKRYTLVPGLSGFDLAVGLTVPEKVDLGKNYAVSWGCGLNPTERDLKQDHAEFAAVSMLGRELAADKLGKLAKEHESVDGNILFSGVRTKYFLAAIVPDAGKAVSVRTGVIPGTERVTTRLSITAGRNASDHFRVYVGPIAPAALKAVHPELERVSDTGWGPIKPISRGILWLLLMLHRYISNYGLVIIVFSALTKVVFFPLTFAGLKSMRHMQQIQPKLKKIQDQFKSDRGRMNQETMALYKKYGVNPFAGCLPLLIQMPIFFALYGVLVNTIELRHSPFLWWIDDLSQPDAMIHLGFKLPLFGWEAIGLLPVLMGIAMFFQQKMTTVDPKMKMMVYLMPAMMVFIFMNMPAGLVLYWLVNNILSIGEQYLTHIHVKPIKD